MNVGTAPNPTIVEPDQQTPRRESAAVGLFRKLSTRRHKDAPERPERGRRLAIRRAHWRHTISPNPTFPGRASVCGELETLRPLV